MPRMQLSERRGSLTVLTLAGRLVLDEGDVPLRERIDALDITYIHRSLSC